METNDYRLASFPERALAFSIDYALFAVAFGLSPRGPAWVALCGAGFVAYQAFFSCGGRASLGKSLLGLRVVNLHEEPLRWDAALIRSATYLVSSVLSLGFLYALVNRNRQAWHDLAAGSCVVCGRERGGFEAALIQAGGLACLSLFVGAWAWQNVGRPQQERAQAVGYANEGLSEIKSLQQTYYARYGRYAPDLFALAEVSADPRAFLRDMAVLFGSQEDVRIQVNARGYRIEAFANDEARTLVAANGP
ncbi:MAG: RDD family protein [Elusimicrobia bacterium]|nr:RDD family protein [Elusimicrobiota bacterium]